MSTTSVSSATNSAADLQASQQQRQLDFQNLSAALQSGDVNSAQQAFAQLQKDSPRLAQALSSSSTSNDSPRITDMKTLASALQSGDISGAQQAFAKLQTDSAATRKTGHGHHHHATQAAAPAATDSDGDNDGSTTIGTNINAVA